MAETVAELQVLIDANTEALTRGLADAQRQVSSFGESVSQGLGMGAGMAAFSAGISAVGSAFGSLKSSVIDFNQQLDQSTAVFTRYFQGNQAQADAFLTTLKGFAAQTPFEFKDLSTFAIRLQNANTNANDIIPTLKAIGNAASATGQLSTVEVDRITLALTQMQMKGKVSGEEMLQLTEANVPAWNILAEATGKSTAELQKMTEKGQISSDVFVKAFRDMYENAGLMEGASKTLAGALSTVQDVGTQAFAEIGRSVYDLATRGANALAQFLSSDAFQTWVEAAKLGVDAVVASVQSLVTALAPVGETIARAFGQLTSGDFSGAFATIGTGIQNALGSAVEALSSFSQQMFGAGADLIGSFASGMLQAASGVLTSAVDVVAQTIAGFLIGSSPPPEGPLKDIDKGGAATIRAWGEGAASAADAAVKPAADAIAANLAELKLSGRDADAAIREIASAIADVESASRDLKYASDDIKSSYDDQIKAVDDQIKALQSAHDVQRDREKLELNLEEIQLRQAEIAAMGDPVLKAQLQTRLDQLKASDADRRNAEAMADAQKAIAGSEKDRLQAQLEAQRMAQQQRDLEQRLKTAKPEDRARIRAQLDELESRKQIAAADAKERAEAARRRVEDAQAKKDQLDVQAQIDGLVDKTALAQIKTQQQVLKDRKEDLGLQEQAEKIQAQIAIGPLKEQRDALVADRDAMLKPLQEQLTTLQRQKDALGEQRQHWQGIKADITAATQAAKEHETALKQAATAAPMPGVDRTFTPDAAAQAAVDRAKTAGESLAQGVHDGFVHWLTDNPLLSGATIAGMLGGASLGAEIGAAAGSIVPVIGTAIGAVVGAGIGAAIGGLTAGMFASMISNKVEQIIGRPLGDAIRATLADLQQTFATQGLGGLVTAVIGRLGAAVDAIARTLAGWIKPFLDWLAALVPQVLSGLTALINGIVGWIDANAGPIGTRLLAWTSAFLTWATTTGPQLLQQLATIAGQVLDWVGSTATQLVGQLLDWATAFVAWVGPAIPDLLTQLGQLLAAMVEWLGANLGTLLDALGAWAAAFVEWVAPKIPPLLVELGKLLIELTVWAATVALPAIVEKLAEWGVAIVEWVAPRIPLLLAELGKLLLELTGWLLVTALPAIVEQLATWAVAFVEWVAPQIPLLLTALGGLLGSVTDWVTQTALPKIVESLKGWGAAFLDWVADVVLPDIGDRLDAIVTAITTWVPQQVETLKSSAKALGTAIMDGLKQGVDDALNGAAGFWDWLKQNFTDKLPDYVKDLLGIHSPSSVFYDIGVQLMEGLRRGIASKLGSVDDIVARVVGRLGGAHDADVPGDVNDWLKAAVEITGVGESWLSGLRWLAMHESSGQADPPHNGFARGLMQTAPGTFEAYRDKSLPDDIYNPVANAVAAIRYIKDTYVNNGRSLDWIIEHWAERGGYASGGIAWTPQIASLAEREPEAIIPKSWFAGSGGAAQQMTINVMVGGRTAEQIYVEGRDLAIRRGRLGGAGALAMGSLT